MSFIIYCIHHSINVKIEELYYCPHVGNPCCDQVDHLHRNLASVIQFVSEQQLHSAQRSRHSSSSQDTPPPHRMTASLGPGPAPAPAAAQLPSSMTMSLPPSLLLPAPVTLSKSCDSLAQVAKIFKIIFYYGLLN